MGSAYTAHADDPSAAFWNPAGLLNTQGFQFQLSDIQDDITHVNSFGDINSPQFALSYSFSKPLLKKIYWALGIAASGFFVKDIDKYDEQSNYEYSFNYGEYVVFLSLAFKLRLFKLGVTWKFIEQNFGLDKQFIQNNNKSLMQKPHDFGIMLNPTRFITFGLMIRDSIRIGDYDIYPKSSQLGIKFDLGAMKSSFPTMVFSTDVIVIKNSLNKMNVGFEYEHKFQGNYSISIRAGSSNMIIGMKRQISDIDYIVPINLKGALGFGIKRNKIGIDFAWVQEIERNPYSKLFVWTINWGL